MSPAMFFTAVDPTLGRIDYDSLPDQALMEIAFESCSDDFKAKWRDENGGFLDVCDWEGVVCDKNGRVMEVYASGSKVQLSTANFAYFPPLTESLSLQQGFIGTLTTSDLPKSLKFFNLESSSFSGSVDMTALPPDLIDFFISFNSFAGSADLTQLPRKLEQCLIGSNKFSGSIDITRLPPLLIQLSVDYNDFAGELSFDALPPNLEYLDIKENRFSGEFRLLEHYPSLEHLNARMTEFSGTAVVHSGFSRRTIFLPRGISRIIDENGNDHPATDSFLKDGPFSGSEGESDDEN